MYCCDIIILYVLYYIIICTVIILCTVVILLCTVLYYYMYCYNTMYCCNIMYWYNSHCDFLYRIQTMQTINGVPEYSGSFVSDSK